MALFNWLTGRAAGVLLHPTALPGPTGIGTFGEKAYRWVEFLAKSGVKYWQTLPLGDTGYSPYQCVSSFAGNPYLIDLPALVGEGLLKPEDLKIFDGMGTTKVDFTAQYAIRGNVLLKAFESFEKNRAWNPFGSFGSFEEFKKRHESWLKPYAMFAALKDSYGGKAWDQWPAEYRNFATAQKQTLPSFEAYEFFQYLFFGQWNRLKSFANSRGVKIIGDIPIYTLFDSSDVWTHPELFDLDKNQQPVCVAGCPPDYFNSDGQHWGNPLYNWSANKVEGYAWWISRIAHNLSLCDVIRIDHFRAFHDYWMIPSSAKTAKEGHWGTGPGMDFFEALDKKIPHAPIIAEDLGDLNDGVRKLLADTGLPGMTVLQFAFGSDANNLYLPHNAKHNQVAYTGTHDNDTLAGWIQAVKEHEAGHALTYLNTHKGVFVESALRSVISGVSRLAIVPAQDLLGLGSDARFNVPGVALSNWDWRMSDEEFARLDAVHLRQMLELYGRA